MRVKSVVMGVELRKKPKDLRVGEREERGYGEGVSTEDVRDGSFWYDVVRSRKTVHHLRRSTTFVILTEYHHTRSISYLWCDNNDIVYY